MAKGVNLNHNNVTLECLSNTKIMQVSCVYREAAMFPIETALPSSCRRALCEAPNTKIIDK